MSVLLVSSDLVITSKAAGAAARTGVALDVAGSSAALAAKWAAAPAQLVVLDLSMPWIDPETLVPQLRAASVEKPTIVAFGPHVHEARLAAARSAGCDEVFSRGQFTALMDQILSRGAD